MEIRVGENQAEDLEANFTAAALCNYELGKVQSATTVLYTCVRPMLGNHVTILKRQPSAMAFCEVEVYVKCKCCLLVSEYTFLLSFLFSDKACSVLCHTCKRM